MPQAVGGFGLVEMLGDDDGEIKGAAAFAIRIIIRMNQSFSGQFVEQLGSDAARGLVEMLGDDESEIKGAAAFAIGNISSHNKNKLLK